MEHHNGPNPSHRRSRPPAVLLGILLSWSVLTGAQADPTHLDAVWQSKFAAGGPKDHSGGQEIATLILEGSLVGWHPERLVQGVEWLESMRQTDPGQKGYMNLFWYWGDRQVADANAVEFVTRELVLALVLAKDRMTSDLRAALEKHLRGNLEGIRRHKVATSYTNITVMKAWNLVALGDALSDATAASEGKSLLTAWLGEVREKGIREFLSPTYTAVDLEGLGCLVHFALDPAVRSLARQAMDYQWSLVLSHWYDPAFRLGGTHSRDYDRLTGHGPLDSWVLRIDHPDLGFGSILTQAAWVAPSAEALALRGRVGSTVVVRWDQSAFAGWYLGPTFAVGSASENYWDMDKTPLVIDLARDPTTPVINYWMDNRRDYYGRNLILEGSGHLKSLHPKPFLAAAQRGPNVLFLAAGTTEGGDRLDSTLTLPSQARFWVDQVEIKPFNRRSAWIPDPGPTAPNTSLTVDSSEGPTALVIHDADPKAGVGVKRLVPATAGTTYRMTVAGRGEIFLYENYYDQAGALIGQEHSRRVNLTAIAPRASLETTAPTSAATLKFWIYSTIGGTTDFRLTDVVAEERTASGTRRLAGFDWEPFVPFETQVPVGSTLTLRLGNAATVLKPVEALDVDGKRVPLVLSNDGLAQGAFRLTAQHSSGVSTRPGWFALYAATAEVADDAALEAFRQSAAATPVSFRLDQGVAYASSGSGPDRLAVSADPGRKLRSSDPAWPTGSGTFWVDGRELGEGLLDR